MADLGRLKIGDFVLDPARNLLTGAGEETETALEPKVVDVLLALAASPGTVLTRDELIDAVWKTEFGADERLTRTISQLRKAFGDERGAPRYIETVSKRGYRLVAAVTRINETNGAPAEAAAPASTAEHVPHEVVPPPIANASEKPSQPWRTWQAYAAVAAVAALAVAGIAASVWRDDPARPVQGVVELRPIVVIDGKAGNDALARQMHATLKRILSSNEVVLVDAAGSGARPRGEFALSGSLEQIGERYEITLYFDNAADGQTLWSHRFARPLADADAMREEAGVNTAFMIGCALKERAAARTKPSLEVFKIYLESCDLVEVWGDAARKLVIAERLTEAAPDDPYGHGLKALANALLTDHGPELSNAQVEGHAAAARDAAARARALDPENVLSRVAELILAPQKERWQTEEAFYHADLDHPAARGTYFWTLRASGRLTDAAHAARRAAAASVLLPYPRQSLAVIHMQLGKPEEAERLFVAALRIWPDKESLHFYRLVNAAFYGDPAQSLPLVAHAESERRPCWRAFVEARARGGASDADRAAIRKACAPQSWSHEDYLARMLASLGDVDGAYEVLGKRSFDEKGSTVFLFYPEMADFRKDARFMPFIAPSGLLEAWLASNRWPDFCADRTLPYDCKSEATRALAAKDGTKSATQSVN